MPFIKKAQYDAARNLAARTIQKGFRSKQNVKQVVKQEVKKVFTKNVESKTAHFNFDNAVFKRRVVTWNVMARSNISRGTGAENGTMIGNRLNLKGLQLRVRCYKSAFSATAPVRIHFGLLKLNTYETGVGALLDQQILSDSSIGQFPARFDTSKCQVIRKFERTIVPQFNAQESYTVINEYIDLKDRIAEFKELSTGWDMKNGNYYVFCYADMWPGVTGLDNATSVQGQAELYYKDA